MEKIENQKSLLGENSSLCLPPILILSPFRHSNKSIIKLTMEEKFSLLTKNLILQIEWPCKVPGTVEEKIHTSGHSLM